MYPFSPKLPSHPGCHTILSRVQGHFLLRYKIPLLKSHYSNVIVAYFYLHISKVSESVLISQNYRFFFCILLIFALFQSYNMVFMYMTLKRMSHFTTSEREKANMWSSRGLGDGENMAASSLVYYMSVYQAILFINDVIELTYLQKQLTFWTSLILKLISK